MSESEKRRNRGEIFKKKKREMQEEEKNAKDWES